MSFNPDANNVACHWISCEMCGNEVVLVNGHGRYFALNIHEIFLDDGEIKANDVLRKTLCHYCLGTLGFVTQAQETQAQETQAEAQDD